MTNFIERGLWTPRHLPGAELVKFSASGLLDAANDAALDTLKLRGARIASLGELLDWKNPLYGDLLQSRVLAISRQTGPISPGLYFNCTIDDPVWDRTTAITEFYPLIVPFADLGGGMTYSVSTFPANANFESLHYRRDTQDFELIENARLTGRNAARLWRPMIYSLNNTGLIFRLMQDIVNPDVLEEVCGIRGESTDTFLGHLAGRQILFVRNGLLLTALYDGKRWLENQLAGDLTPAIHLP